MKKITIEVPFIPDDSVEHDIGEFICQYSINGQKFKTKLKLEWEVFAELEQKHVMGTYDYQVSNLSKQKLMLYLSQQIQKEILPKTKIINVSMDDIINIQKVDKKKLPPLKKWETEV